MPGPPRGNAPPPPPGRQRSLADVARVDTGRSLSSIEPAVTGGLPKVGEPTLPPPEPETKSQSPAPQSPPPNETKAEKRARMRMNVVNELVATEETYVRQLNQLIEEYVQPLRTNRLCTPDQHAGLFPDITVIVNLNENFLASLQEKQRDWDNETSELGDEFLSFAPFFKMYQNYVNNHERASKIQRVLRENVAFQDFCETSKNETGGLDLGSLLILPIQRVPRYELCLRELLKYTEENHIDYENLREAMGMVREVNGMINNRMKEYDAREQVREIERRMGNAIQLVSPARRFVREGTLWKVCRKKDRKYIFFLFTDMMLYCSETTTGDGLKFHNQLPFNSVFEVVDIEESTKYGDRCFEVHSSIKSFLAFGDDAAQKYEWMEEIKRVFDGNRVLRQRGSVSGTELRPAPIWFPDDFSDNCMVCKSKFSILRRRHHCRYCGKLICNDCSPMKLPNFAGKQGNTVRVCDLCFEKFKHMYPDQISKLRTSSFSGIFLSPRSSNGAVSPAVDLDVSADEDSDPDDDDSDDESVISESDDRKTPEPARRGPPRKRFETDIARMNRVAPPRAGSGRPTTPQRQAPSPRRQAPSPRRADGRISNGAMAADPMVRTSSLSENFSEDAQRQIAFMRNELESEKNKYASTIEVMKSKVDNFRRQNERKQQRIRNLEEENARLRKSKVDLVTQKTAEINRLKKRIKVLERQVGVDGNNY